MTMEIISKRIGVVRETGNTIAVALREELLDLGLKIDQPVTIILYKDKDGSKKIVIEKV